MTQADMDNLNFCSAVVPNDLLDATCLIEQPILMEIDRLGYSDDEQFAIRLALEEAISNAYKHGNSSDPSKQISARWALSREKAVIYVQDQGKGFNPREVPDPRLTENLSRPFGRGIMLMSVYMDEVKFSTAGNQVCLIKVRK